MRTAENPRAAFETQAATRICRARRTGASARHTATNYEHTNTRTCERAPSPHVRDRFSENSGIHAVHRDADTNTLLTRSGQLTQHLFPIDLNRDPSPASRVTSVRRSGVQEPLGPSSLLLRAIDRSNGAPPPSPSSSTRSVRSGASNQLSADGDGRVAGG